MEIARVASPLSSALADELIVFWESIFELSFADLRAVLCGKEHEHNQHTVYVVRGRGQLVGTSHLTVSRALPELGGLGEVAVAPDSRRNGIGTSLCTRARDDFRRHGGRALLLGTGNPVARRIYARLGWRELEGTQVLVNTTDGSSPEDFVAGWFAGSAPAGVRPGCSADRLPMIPLLVGSHPWKVLDTNAGMLSTRCAVQSSCMGLYPTYQRLRSEGRGDWFAACTVNGLLIGLSTVRIRADGRAYVDGFAHPDCEKGLTKKLFQAAIEWAGSQGIGPLCAQVCTTDLEKVELLRQLGFASAGEPERAEVAGRQFMCNRMERATNGTHP